MKLNDADKLYVGATPVDKVYAGANLVWSSASPFLPSDLPGLVVWLDASQASTSSPWENLGSGPDMLVQGTPAPVIQPSTLNGLPVMHYKMGEGRHRLTSGTGANFDYTLFHLTRIWGTNSGRVVTAIYPGGGNMVCGFWNGFKDVGYADGFYGDQKPYVVGEWKLYTVDCETPTIQPRLMSDGVQVGILFPTPPSAAGFNGTLAISGYADPSDEETCDADVAVVIQYNRKLPDAEREQVLGYIRAKWGMP